ncbi:MAG: EAL domain-containing protein [Alphaproteobacteria bacterium]|nr:EAL domain-containing protein [Alphaproteobacteria bacterium]
MPGPTQRLRGGVPDSNRRVDLRADPRADPAQPDAGDHRRGSVATEPGFKVTGSFRRFFENAIEGIYQTTPDGRYLRANPALARVYGFASPAALIAGLTDIAGQLYVDPARRDAFKRAMDEDGVVRDFEAQVYRADGSVIWITENARCVRGSDGAIQYYEGTVEDITARKASEEHIRLLATVFETVSDGILIVDPARIVRAVNPAYVALVGAPAAEIVGRALDILAPDKDGPGILDQAWNAAEVRGLWSGEATCRRAQGDPFLAALSICAVREDARPPSHFVVTCADISQRRMHEQNLWHTANFDMLTQLPNRRLIAERLQQAMLRAARQRASLTVLFLDLNGFKQVNDGLGHQAGDELLKLVAARLRACTRQSDVVGRLGGDEFVVVAPDVADRQGGHRLAEKILLDFAQPFRVAGQEIFCQFAVGVAFYPQDGETADELIRNADVAMYVAKKDNSRRFVSFEHSMLPRLAQRLRTENELRRAIERDELLLHYQPRVETRTGRVLGAEALIRWRHPERGLVMPGDFIALAEECGLIAVIGESTLRRACAQFLRWQADGLALAGISVNLSPRQFLDVGLVRTIEAVMRDVGIAPACLELELTESAMSVDMERAVATLRALKGLGVKLSIDDFGTGYSSLGRLKSLPIDAIKIDRSFIRGLGGSPTDRRIVEAVTELAEVLGFRVVAEGVETIEQADILRHIRCHELQGFLISRPVDADDLAALVRRWNAGALPAPPVADI